MIVTVTGRVVKRCPYKDESDHGTVALTFDVPEGDAPELHGLASYLAGFRDEAISHEDFTRNICLDLPVIEIKTTWNTAGLNVEVVDRRAVPGEPHQFAGGA